jgi:hypothetical protein
MPEHRHRYDTGREDQDVNGRQQNQGGATKSLNWLLHKIIYYINEYSMQ